LNEFLEKSLNEMLAKAREAGVDPNDKKFLEADRKRQSSSKFIKTVPNIPTRAKKKKRSADFDSKVANLDKLEKEIDWLNFGAEKYSNDKEKLAQIKTAKIEKEALLKKIKKKVEALGSTMGAGIDYEMGLELHDSDEFLQNYIDNDKDAVMKYLSDLNSSVNQMLAARGDSEAAADELKDQLAAFEEIPKPPEKEEKMFAKLNEDASAVGGDSALSTAAKVVTDTGGAVTDIGAKALKGVAKTAGAVVATMGALWGLDKINKAFAPDKIENSQSVVDVVNYLHAYFGISEEHLSRIKGVAVDFQKPTADYIKKKRDYIVDVVFLRNYADWSDFEGVKKGRLGAWLHRPIYIVDLFTARLEGYDSYRISVGFDVIPHPAARAGGMVAINEDGMDVFYAQDYNPQLRGKLTLALGNTAHNLLTAMHKLQEFKKNNKDEGGTIDGVAESVVDEFISFIKIFQDFYNDAQKALDTPGMEPAHRAFYLDKVGRVMEIIRS
jgi:hypothetical protein